MRKLLLLAFLLSVPAAGQTDTILSVEPGAHLQIRGISFGEVVVEAWDRPREMEVRGIHPSSIELEISRTPAGVSIRERRPVRASLDKVRLELRVPASTRVSITGSHAVVEVTGVKGGVDVTTLQGGVTIRGVNGPLKLHSTEGSFDVEDVTGVAQLRTTAAAITVRALAGDLTVETVAGDIELADIEAHRVEATSHAGNITFRGAIEAEGLYDFATSRGNIELQLAAAVGATVTAGTVSGDFASDFETAVAPIQGEKFDFTLGNGAGRVELITHSGSLALRKTR